MSTAASSVAVQQTRLAYADTIVRGSIETKSMDTRGRS
jgi:hypothetical protein